MDFCEKKQRLIRRQCIRLGAAALVLTGILTIRSIRQNSPASTEVSCEKEQTGQSAEDTGYSAAGSYSGIRDETEDANAGEHDETDLLMLVNKDHPLPAGYEVTLHWLKNGSCAVAEEMYGALQEMLTDGSADGRQFVVASGYRDTEKQRELLEEDIQAAMQERGLTWEQAYILETRETMPPGCSEHETGLAVDIVSLDYQILDEMQETTPENLWLRENCSRYGFILRYPKGKEDITGIDHESWHFRYVGIAAAEEIMGRGITLEEYLEEKYVSNM